MSCRGIHNDTIRAAGSIGGAVIGTDLVTVQVRQPGRYRISGTIVTSGATAPGTVELAKLEDSLGAIVTDPSGQAVQIPELWLWLTPQDRISLRFTAADAFTYDAQLHATQEKCEACR